MRNKVEYLVSAVIICHIVNIDCQSINICANPVSGQPCEITCNTTDFNQDIQFLLGSAVQGTCTVFGSVSACGTGMNQSGTITTYSISSLSRGTHEGDWSCKYGATPSMKKSLVVKTIPNTVEITQTIPEANLTTGIKELQVTGQCFCIYPSTTDVSILYKEGQTGTFYSLSTVPATSISTSLNPGLPCLADEFKIEIINYTLRPDFERTKSNVYLKIQFGTYTTRENGPFKFSVEKSTDKQTDSECKGSFHCGFWPVSLIDLVSSSIGAILELKEVLIIKGFFKTKEINVAIFNGVPIIVAIVIGVVLGIVMECHICGTTLGVSIGIGLFIAAIQWILITFWNCKKEYYRAVIKITRETYADDLGDCKSEAYKDLSCRVTKAIESLYKNVEGRQTVVEVNFSPGLKVTFDLGSQGFSDCSVLSDTLEIALQSGLISPFEVSSDGFKFMPLKDWKDSKGETSGRSNGDRARSPASASAVKVEAENKSHIKPTGKKTEESSLHIKSYGSPLPEVPKVRHNQLDPIPKSDNGEMENSHNKPYTKLYGSPLPEVPQGRSIPLVPIERQDIDEMESPKVEKKKKKKKKKKREDSVDNEEDN